MKKIFLITMILLMATACYGGATQYNLGRKNTPIPSDWFRTGRYRDYGTNWAREIDILVAFSSNPGTGKIWYIDSNVTNEGSGSDWLNATDTLNEAIVLSEADSGDDRGDVFLMAQGHSETMGAAADEVDVTVSGASIVGLGNGLLKPIFDYTDDVTGAFAIGADDVRIFNTRFHANVTDVNEAIEIEAGSEQVGIIDCLFDVETEDTDDFLECIDSRGAASDRLEVIGCEFYMGAGTCNAGIAFADSDYARIICNTFYGDYAIADVNNGVTASNYITIEYNTIFNGTIGGDAGLNAQPCIELVATTTGTITNNYLFCNVATPDAAVVGADMYLADNVYSETEATSAAPMWLTTDTLQNKIGVDDAANLGTTTSVTSDGDGSILERLEFLQYNTLTTITATTDFTASTDVMFTVAGGAIEIVSMFGQCTTLAAGSPGTMTIECDATAGADYDNDLSTTVNVDALGAGDTIRFTNAIDEGVLTLTANTGAGQTLSWFAPAGDIEQTLSSTGTGAVKWYMTYRTLDTGVTVTAP